MLLCGVISLFVTNDNIYIKHIPEKKHNVENNDEKFRFSSDNSDDINSVLSANKSTNAKYVIQPADNAKLPDKNSLLLLWLLFLLSSS